MSRTPPSPTQTARSAYRLTVDQFDRMARSGISPEGQHVELLGGRIHEMTRGQPHNIAVIRLATWLVFSLIFTAGVAGNLIALKGSSFKYRAPRGTTGVIQVTLREKRNSGGIFAVTLKTKAAWTAGAADEDETTTRITLNFGGKCFSGSAKHVH